MLDLADGGLAVSFWRLLCGGLFHACMAGIVAFFIGLEAWYDRLADGWVLRCSLR